MNKEIKNTIKNEKGFTLVELIVVIAILAILAAVAVPNYINYQYRSAINTDLSTVSEAIRAARIKIIEDGNATAIDGKSFKDLDEFTGSEALASKSGTAKTTNDLKFKVTNDVISVDVGGIQAGSYKPNPTTVTENAQLPKPSKS